MALWNAGIPVRNEDLRPNSGLNVRFSKKESADIFLCEVSAVTRTENKFSIDCESGSNSGVNVSFDFLDNNDGAFITIWHESKFLNPTVSGTIVGQNVGVIDLGRWREPRNIESSLKKLNQF